MNGPEHIAIIMDGNRRWAKERGASQNAGHRAGAEKLDQICAEAAGIGVKYLTVYAFSTENWKRSVSEVSFLMNLIAEYLKRCLALSMENDLRFRCIGDRSQLSSALREKIAYTEERTSKNAGMLLTVALNYGGRDELTRAFRRMLKDGVSEGSVTEEMISSYLDTASVPDPDLLIRTSGECRLSNFLLWQAAYSEFYFTPKYWPDFSVEALTDALEVYKTRKRRFGASDGETPDGPSA